MKKVLLFMAIFLFLSAPCFAQEFKNGAINIIGVNTSLSTSFVPISDTATVTFPSAAATVEVVSTSTDDGPAGTGVLTLQIQGLNASWAQATETITMNGTTAAVSVNSYIRINKIEGLTFGSLAAASGEITLSLSGDIYAKILSGNTVSKSAIYSVPNYKYATVDYATFSAVLNPAKFELRVRPFGGYFKPVDAVNINGSDTTRQLASPVIAYPKSDIVVYGASTSGTAEVTATMQINLNN